MDAEKTPENVMKILKWSMGVKTGKKDNPSFEEMTDHLLYQTPLPTRLSRKYKDKIKGLVNG
jgi:hypothetical protein